jgi:hypothetical protein
MACQWLLVARLVHVEGLIDATPLEPECVVSPVVCVLTTSVPIIMLFAWGKLCFRV